MASFSDITTLVTPAGTITFNAASGNTWWVDPNKSTGLGMGEVRSTIDDKGQTSGFIIHDAFEKGAMLVLAGTHVCDTTANRDSREASLKAALRSILAANGTLNFGSGLAVTVRCNVGAEFPQWSGNVKGFVFGLVSASAI